MNRAQFDEVRRFIYTDIEREIQLAHANREALRGIGVHAGGGNFLAALGLLSYTDFAGKLITKKQGSQENFNTFFDRLGASYSSFRQKHNVYKDLRSDLVHAYAENECVVSMKEVAGRGVTVRRGRYWLYVPAYFRDFRKAFDALQGQLPA